MRQEEGNEGHVLEDCKIVHETEKALLVRLVTGAEIWVPKSVVHDDSEIWKKDEEGDLTIKRWWAEKEGHG